ncbi:hypothetical protein D3C86_2097150 [compost metagenome]
MIGDFQGMAGSWWLEQVGAGAAGRRIGMFQVTPFAAQGEGMHGAGMMMRRQLHAGREADAYGKHRAFDIGTQ